MLKSTLILILFSSFLLWQACKHNETASSEFSMTSSAPIQKNQKLVIVLIDGPRWEETWGDNTHQYQPYLRDSLKKEGCLFTNFYNNGNTFTIPGHTSLLTGHYQNIANDGSEFPMYPSLGQLFLGSSKKSKQFAWLIASKDKIEIFKSCTNISWNGKSTPSTDCGPKGAQTGYRDDAITFQHAKTTLLQDHPDFLFIQLKEPDASGHANNWQGYLDGIKQGDTYAWKFWKLLQSLPDYKNKTTFVITNDHGRHTTGVADGFISHGDNCIGCRHINLFMAGPKINKDQIITNSYELIDLHKTLCSMCGLNAQFSEGKMISEVLIP